MNEIPANLKARSERKTAKRDEKKYQIAQSAIKALQELGFANTSLRDIAQKSDMSLGMLHYYFQDRTDLIIYCVEIYKRQFIADITAALETAQGRDGVIEAFSNALATSIAHDASTHRLWYDIRNQALFDDTFRPIVAEIEFSLIQIIRDTSEKIRQEQIENAALSYALLDGVFRYLLQAQIDSHAPNRKEMIGMFRSVLDRFL